MQTVEILGRVTKGRDDPAGFKPSEAMLIAKAKQARRRQIAVPAARAQLRRRAFYRRGFFQAEDQPEPLSKALAAMVVLAIGFPIAWWMLSRQPKRSKAARSSRARRERRIARRTWAQQ